MMSDHQHVCRPGLSEEHEDVCEERLVSLLQESVGLFENGGGTGRVAEETKSLSLPCQGGKYQVGTECVFVCVFVFVFVFAFVFVIVFVFAACMCGDT